MQAHDAIVIGAGNGGLTAAVTLAAQGLDVLLLERHNIPGGAATSFCRGRFEFEVALHQLSGLGSPTKPGPLRLALQKLGVIDDLTFVEMDDLYSVRLPDGFAVELKPDRERVVAELKRRFPREAAGIDRFFGLMAAFANDMIATFIFRDPEPSRTKYPHLYGYAFKSTREVLDDCFEDPLLKTVLSVYWGYLGVPPTQLAFAYLAMIFFQYVEFKPYHIKGGSQALSNALLDKFLAHGGTVRFNCGVERIRVTDGAVRGVVAADGTRYDARHIVSNASQVTTYAHLVGPEHLPHGLQAELGGRNLSTSALALFVGFDCEPAELGITTSTNFLMANTDISDGIFARMQRLDLEDDLMVLSCYDIADPQFSPPGTCQANIVALKYGQPWLQVPPDAYHDHKYRCAEAMLARVEQIYPGLRGHIEEIEAATPLTFMRYLNTPAGAIYGYEQLTKDSLFFQPGRAAPIEGLWFAGGWTGDCGFEPTLRSGQAAAGSILKRLGKKK